MTEQNPYGPPPQPGYDAPPPAAPGYGGIPPQGPPPGYPPAGEPGAYPGYGAYAPVPPPRKSRKTLWTVLGVVGGVLLLGGGTLAYLVYDVTSNAGTEKIVLPATFKELTKNTDPQVTDSIEKELTSGFGKGDGNWKPTGVGALYQDAQSQPQLVAVGAYGKVLAPKQELDQAFTGITASGPKLSGRHAVDAGPKGGTMECAVAADNDTTMGLCAWADNSSIVIVMKVVDSGTQPDLDKLAADSRDLRAVAEVPK
ncbi:hypothetical protein ACIOJE_09210 [Kitasatospora sp. NPDC087861]|uniref:hypothetical protein n=1 Tax=Kitasatospora sp. NPDC087861 TaxID=3364070 RepID=UPI00380D2EF6